jgi:hypothetical protein
VNPPAALPWKTVAGGLLVMVRATPRSGRDAIEGVERRADGTVALKARVRAAPEEGAANEALGRLLARAASVPASAVTIVRGATSRQKSFQISGDASAIAAALAAAVGAAAQGRQ